jgi:UDP-2,3-diacylglucosamine pyrophosphatase LpxH
VRRVFIISDLHLGGVYPEPRESKKRGFRLCTHADVIERFVKLRTKEIAEQGPCEIVLNGDTVDFLAERDLSADRSTELKTWSSFTADSQAAVAKFKAIVCRDGDVFKSFGPFLDAGGRLTILLGNHDIELSLPDVRRELKKALGVKPEHNFEFFYDGEAYTIGDALIEHGNRYDSWNQIDYDGLRHSRSFQSRRLPVPKEYMFTAPPGSDMVTKVINGIKRDYAFVDLLKPETAAVAPMLLALEPGYRSRIADIALFYYRTRNHGLVSATTPRFGGDIRAEHDIDAMPGGDMAAGIGGSANGFGEEIAGRSTRPAESSEQEDALKEMLQATLGSDAEEFLADVDAQMAEIDPSGQLGKEISASDTVSRIFGFASLLFGRTSQPYQKRVPALLKAFRGLQSIEAFTLEKETAKEYLEAAQELAEVGHFRYVVFGHTHLAKRVPLANGGLYLNSGTWADVLRFPVEIVKSEAEALPALNAFVKQMRNGDFSGWTLFDPTYVRLDVDDDGKVAGAELETFSE